MTGISFSTRSFFLQLIAITLSHWNLVRYSFISEKFVKYNSWSLCFSNENYSCFEKSSIAKSCLFIHGLLFQTENQELKDENSKLSSQLEQAQSEKDKEIENLKVSQLEF